MKKSGDKKANKSEKDEKILDISYDPEVTKQDIKTLHERNQSMDTGRDEFLAERDKPVDFSRDDLDIPTGENDDPSNKNKKIPDEENEQFERRGSRSDSDVSKGKTDKIIDDDSEDYT